MAHALQIPNYFSLKRLRQDHEMNRRQWSGVRTLQSPVWLKEIYDKISALKMLKENWDSYGGLPVADGAISNTRVLLSNLEIEDMPAPHVAALPDGGIGLHWRVGARDLEIEVEPSGVVHCLKTEVDGESDAGDVRSFTDAQNALDWVLGK